MNYNCWHKIIINLRYTFGTIFFTFSWNLFFGFLLDQPFTSITLHYNKLYHVKHNMFPSITSFMLKLDWQLINGFSSKFTSFVSKPLPYYIYLVFISFFFHQLKSSKVLWYHTYKIKQPGLFAISVSLFWNIVIFRQSTLHYPFSVYLCLRCWKMIL